MLTAPARAALAVLTLGALVTACSPSTETEATNGASRFGSTDAASEDASPDTSADGPLFDGGGGDAGDDAADALGDVAISDVDGAGLQDVLPDVAGDACSDAGGVPGPIQRVCAAPTDDECDGHTDVNAALPNGAYGNGFDDDCDGKVDEGCACGPSNAPGTTKPCWLVPASQVDPTSQTPVGWCTANSRGTVACVAKGSGEFATGYWDGYCKGAEPPFADDVCPPGDYDCDGLDSNSRSESCDCAPPASVQCPVDAIVTSPYPNPKDLTQKKSNPLDPNPGTPFVIDGASWIQNGMASQATNWTWQVTGGDCDNILPHATFALYDGADTTSAGTHRIGSPVTNLGQNGAQHGFVAGGAGSTQHQIWPAFSLSGDYVIQGDFDLNGQHYSCTQKVQVRWPGLRAELCWDAVGAAPGHDLDLHVARLQNSATCPNGHDHGWTVSSCGTAPASDDCYYKCSSGCRTMNDQFCGGQDAPPPGWGYGQSGSDACHGWGSFRGAIQTCDNPRLDRDNLGCDPSVDDPNAACDESSGSGCFCGPENINLDAPSAGDRFLVGVQYYSATATAPDAHPHVNIYCNGERTLAFGYDPTTSPPTTFPVMQSGYDGAGDPTNGDLWVVAQVTWDPSMPTPCTIDPIHSVTPKAAKDGSVNACVDTGPRNQGDSAAGWPFTSPATPVPNGGYCWH